MPDHWITIAEASKLSGYSRIHLRETVRLGRIRGRKVATVWLISQLSLSAYLREQAQRGEKRGRKPIRD